MIRFTTQRRIGTVGGMSRLAATALAFALFASSTHAAHAQDAEPATEAPAMGKIGPGAPPADATAPAAPAAPVAKPKAKAGAAKGIHLSPVTPVAPSVHVHDKVLEECRLQSLLPQMIAERNPDVVLSDGAGAMKLELKIVDIHAPSGGWFSGPKWVTVDGRLLQGKTVKGSFIAKETSMASATACGMLNKVIVVLAGDIAQWLNHPSKDARLGSAR